MSTLRNPTGDEGAEAEKTGWPDEAEEEAEWVRIITLESLRSRNTPTCCLRSVQQQQHQLCVWRCGDAACFVQCSAENLMLKNVEKYFERRFISPYD